MSEMTGVATATENLAPILEKQAIPAAYAFTFLRLQPAQVAILGLSTEQIKIAQRVYDNNVRARLTLEGELAKSTKVNDEESIIDIPSYSKTKDLEADFYGDLSAQLGEAAANKIKTSLGISLRAENGGYGVQPQILYVTAVDSTSWEIVHKLSTSDGITTTKTHDVSPDNLGSYVVFASLFPHLPHHE